MGHMKFRRRLLFRGAEYAARKRGRECHERGNDGKSPFPSF